MKYEFICSRSLKRKSFINFITKTHILNLIKCIKLLRIISFLENLFIDFVIIFIIIMSATLIERNIIRNTIHLSLYSNY